MVNQFIIKPLMSKDEIYGAISLAHDVFMEFEAPVYSKEGVKSFLEFIYGDTLKQKHNDGTFHIWGCYKNDILAGMMALRDGNHISLAFTDKDFHRQGVGRMLFSVLRDYSEEQGFNKITVNSSPYGLLFYKALGFMETDHERVDDGIRYTPMIYKASLNGFAFQK